jgi:hypothetical protein
MSRPTPFARAGVSSIAPPRSRAWPAVLMRTCPSGSRSAPKLSFQLAQKLPQLGCGRHTSSSGARGGAGQSLQVTGHSARTPPGSAACVNAQPNCAATLAQLAQAGKAVRHPSGNVPSTQLAGGVDG